MPRHLFYNMKIGLLIILFSALAAEHYMDYEFLFDVSVGNREQPVLKSMGSIDQYIKQYNYAKYAHVIDDNIFSENVEVDLKTVEVDQKTVEKKPPDIVPTDFKPFSIQLEIRGIAITPQRKMVMIWDKQKNQSEILLEKEKLYKWKVVSIEKDLVILEYESGELYEFIVNDETLTNIDM